MKRIKRCRFCSRRLQFWGQFVLLFLLTKTKNNKKEKQHFLRQRGCGESYRIMTYLQEKYSYCVEVDWWNCSHSDKMSGSTKDCGRRYWEPQKKCLNGTNDIKTHFLFVSTCVLEILFAESQGFKVATRLTCKTKNVWNFGSKGTVAG